MSASFPILDAPTAAAAVMGTAAFMGADRHIGGRKTQQDQVLCLSTANHKHQLLLVADGVGGHGGGAEAAQAIVDAAQQLFPAALSRFANGRDFLANFCAVANQAVQRAHTLGEAHGFSTLVALLTDAERAFWVHVGDSRLYGFKGGELFHQTRDHSLVQRLVDFGKITEAERDRHSERNRVLQVMGMPNIQPTFGETALSADMSFLLCTDGFWDQIRPPEMRQILAAEDLQFAANLWVRQAARRGGAGGDNIALALWRMPPKQPRRWLSFRG
ncbi:PP2C family protein-serine/threonine phosphatase [Halothiobacillus sp. DCM-1]|uniref:PP2C family protein-serine/threonine phosphatase n=1 Tax=Halothiobacillus sp. DCM-1 TaxID=3112558 RepID=UPI00324F6315